MLLTQWFEPEPAFKGLAFARALRDSGLDVEVVTGFPNYPGGKVYPGYRIRMLQREIIDGIPVTRLPLYPSHDGSALRRILNYFSFAASASIYGLFRPRRPQVIYAYHPPLTVGVCASLIGLVRRIPVVLDIQDMWPDTLRATGMMSSDRVLRIVGLVCDWLYRRVDRIVVLSDGFRRILLERGVPAAKIEVIQNWCDEAKIASPSSHGQVPEGFPSAACFRVLFAGNIGRAQALEAVLETAQLIKPVAPDVVFIFLGNGIEVARLRELAAKRDIDNVVFFPAVPMEEVGGWLAAADALLVHLKRDPLFEITIPSKTQAYMAAGRPILMAVDGDAARLVSAAECGVLAESEHPSSLADAVLRLRSMPLEERQRLGQNGKRFYWDRLSLRTGASRFADLFRSLVSGVK